jgi:hypothetical protein
MIESHANNCQALQSRAQQERGSDAAKDAAEPQAGMPALFHAGRFDNASKRRITSMKDL